jgi:hypothetical protein
MFRLMGLTFTLFCWVYGQSYPPNLLRYYNVADMEEMQRLTPQKYLTVLYEFTDSYEIVEAPPHVTAEAIKTLKETFDPRAFERKWSEDIEITVGAYRIRLKSHERVLSELRVRYPDYDWTPRPASQQNLPKVARP